MLNIRNLVRQYLAGQVMAYMAAGIFLTMSHNLSQYSFLRYLGHMFISTSFIILISLSRYQLARRIAVLDILFSAALSLVTIFAIFMSILDEIILTHGNIPVEYIGESSPVGILLIIYFWAIIFMLTPSFNIRRRLNLFNLRGLLMLFSFSFIAIGYISIWKSFFLNIYSYLFLTIGFLLYLAVLILIYRDRTRSHTWRVTILSIERILFLFIILFLVSGLISLITKAFPLSYFLGPGIAMCCYFFALGPRLHRI